ncbi:MAG: TonB-dependent receptor [Dialister sp.]|uniref:TonB-dependent receptor n=1 Tax=Dialister sp. TaxID=1955814 RepID=UPI002E75EBCF|nr:TonB-dependent receptor [Dialister sp.]MEE0291185.1 TonB-dependent receptor [Dialister sp.]
MSLKSKEITALLAVLALTGAGSVSAEMPVYTLKGITVTANRQAERLQDVPANVQVVTEKDIQKRNVQNTAQAVAMVTGVSASQSVEGTVNLRGYDSRNILVLVDGQPMNTAWNGDVDWNMIPVENIRKIEVVSGGQSALYGGRAVGGVINIMTKTQKQDGLHGSATVSYGSNATVNQGYALNGKKDKVSFGAFYNSHITNGWKDYYASGSHKSGYTYTTNEKDARGTSSNYLIGNRGRKYVMSENYGFNIGYDFNEDQRLTYKFTRANYDWEYKDPESYIRKGDTVIWPGKDIDDSKYASFYGTRGWRAYNMHSLTYNDQKNKIHAHIGMTDYFKDGYTQPGYTKGTLDGNLNGSGDKYSYPSKSIDFDLNKRWAFGNHNLLAGTSYGRDKFDETIYSIKDWKSWSSSGSVTQKAGGKDKYWSLYAQDKWNFAPKWTAYIGGRYDHYEDYDGYDTLLSGDNDKGSHSYHKFSPKLSLDYAVNPDTNVYLSYGKSFNTPILYQLFRYSTRMGLIYPNSGLTPETTDTWELGLKKKIANKTDIHADVFYAKTEDYIRLMSYEGGQGKGKRYENNGDEKTHGFEVSLTQRHSNIWTSYINYTWQTAKNNGYKDYNVPRHLLHLGTTYNKAPWTINLDGMFISNRYLDITPGDTKKYDYHSGHFRSRDAYFLMNLSTNYQFNKNFGIQFAVNNLFDREYYDEDISNNHYYIGDGRTYTLTARYSF